MALPCTEHVRITGYTQLTWRKSLSDIEATLEVNATKLYEVGLRQAVCSSTLADANERRDWRILSEFGHNANSPCPEGLCKRGLGFELNIARNVYALDSSSIDLYLSLFDWASPRSGLGRDPASYPARLT